MDQYNYAIIVLVGCAFVCEVGKFAFGAGFVNAHRAKDAARKCDGAITAKIFDAGSTQGFNMLFTGPVCKK